MLKELFRKSIHLCSALVPLALYYFYWPTIVLLILALVLYSVCEVLRLKGIWVPVVSFITEMASRKRDENKFVLGPVTLVCGILLAILCLPYEGIKIGVFALAFGDGCASIFGKLFGRIKIPFAKGKTLAGCIACFVAVFLTTYLAGHNLWAAFWTGIFTMFIEALPLFDFDNLIIPVLAGYFYLLQTGYFLF